MYNNSIVIIICTHNSLSMREKTLLQYAYIYKDIGGVVMFWSRIIITIYIYIYIIIIIIVVVMLLFIMYNDNNMTSIDFFPSIPKAICIGCKRKEILKPYTTYAHNIILCYY